MHTSPIKLNLRARQSHTTVTIRDSQPTSAIGIPQNSTVCPICTIAHAAYCCPRCFKPYCSSDCYKKHDVICIEEFSKSHCDRITHMESLHTNLSNPSNPSTNTNPSNHSNEFNTHQQDLMLQLYDKITEINNNKNMKLTSDERYCIMKLKQSVSLQDIQWNPYWEDIHIQLQDNVACIKFIHTGTGCGQVDVVYLHHLRYELHQLSDSLKGLTDERTLPSLSLLQFQILGALLGYATAMRSTLGGWARPVGESPDLSLSPSECVTSLLQSTPISSSRYRPISVSDAISGWVTSSPPSLPRGEKRGTSLRKILCDACRLLSCRELAVYAIADMWIVCMVAQGLPNSDTIDMLRRIAGSPPPSSERIADVLLPIMMRYYSDVFSVSSKKKLSVLDRLTRKSFLILLVLLQNIEEEWNFGIFSDLKEYISEYCKG